MKYCSSTNTQTPADACLRKIPAQRENRGVRVSGTFLSPWVLAANSFQQVPQRSQENESYFWRNFSLARVYRIKKNLRFSKKSAELTKSSEYLKYATLFTSTCSRLPIYSILICI
jgi:hypothetical protein